MTFERKEPEDFSGWQRASVDSREWEISCGVESCHAFLADASWFDVQLAMILNSNDEWTAREAMGNLPALHYRRFRMHALFPPHWFRSEDGTWEVRDVEAARKKRAGGDMDVYKQRYIRGRLLQAELSQEAMLPAKVRCPACLTLQVIDRRVRKGAPPLATEEKAS